MSRIDLFGRAEQLRQDRVPCVLATVIRADKPTSAKPGDSAVIFADGSIEGFVGGSCAESTVRTESLKVLSSHESTLLLITPGIAEGEVKVTPGLVSVSNPCLSGGTLEMFLEPAIPDPLVFIYGHGPIAQSLVELGPLLGFDARHAETVTTIPVDLAAVIVATHGTDETELLSTALKHNVSYVGLVASNKRGTAVRETLDLSEADRKRIHTPAGLDIGARTPSEVALSIFAEIISTRPRHSDDVGTAFTTVKPDIAVDLVCNMEVLRVESSISAEYEGKDYWFCGKGCRDAFLFDPTRYLAVQT